VTRDMIKDMIKIIRDKGKGIRDKIKNITFPFPLIP